MLWRKRLINVLRSLRLRATALLGGSLALVILAAAALAWGVAQSDFYLVRASESERQQELLILLSGRVSDYALAIMDAAEDLPQGRERLQEASSQMNAVFELLERSIETQVAVLKDTAEKNAEATEGLGVARMRAMIHLLDGQIHDILEVTGERERAQGARIAVTQFGINFTPLLAQAVERERREAAAARAAMGELRKRLTAAAAAIGLCAVLFACALYFLALRPIMRRLQDTSEGVAALTQGALKTRLPLRGHDELTLFMAQFNRMAASFGRRQRKLSQAQDGLQETIAERTAELEEANRRLNAIDQNRRRFFTDISHELRTPLTVIRGEAEMTLRHAGAALNGDIRQSLETIAARAGRLHRHLDDMLRVARSETGRIELSLSEVDLSQVMCAAMEDIGPLARQKDIQITFKEPQKPPFCIGDRNWLRLVLSGLIANAIKYSDRHTEIVISCWSEGGNVAAEISDEGCGLNSTELISVFERFERGSSSFAAAQAGHGVGLALAKWVIAEHGGNIRLESPGRLWKNKNTQKRGLTALVSLRAVGGLS